MKKSGIFISGSGTEVGKTFIAVKLIELLAKQQTVKARKPIESGCQSVNGTLIAKDAQLLAAAAGNYEPIEVVCPFRFKAHTSAEKASADEGVHLTLIDLVKPCLPPNADDFMVIEGAGGWYSPIAKQVLNSDLAAALKLPLVLVVKDELGAINQALLCIFAAQSQNLPIAMLVLNQIKANNLANEEALNAYTDVPVVVFSAVSGKFSKSVLAYLR